VEAAAAEEPGTLVVTTRLDPEVHAKLAARAAKADRTISAELRRAVRFYLDARRDREATP
jgi:predicted transcriptional regulator